LLTPWTATLIQLDECPAINSDRQLFNRTCEEIGLRTKGHPCKMKLFLKIKHVQLMQVSFKLSDIKTQSATFLWAMLVNITLLIKLDLRTSSS
jgi:hypothetical protein